MYTSSIRSKELHDIALNKTTVVRFVGTGSFLTRYSNGNMK